MQFATQEDRIAAIKKACDELGQAYGELKYREQLLVEAKQGFVPSSSAGNKIPDPVAVTPEPEPASEKPSTKKKAASKKAPAKKKAEPVVEVEAEAVAPEDIPDTPDAVPEKLTAVVEAEPEASAPEVVEAEGDEPCPITSANDLRNLMFKRYTELGKSNEAHAALKKALTESTGAAEAKEVTEDKFAAAYEAIMAVEV